MTEDETVNTRQYSTFMEK